MQFKRGDLVMTPKGEGLVMYVRMAPPDWREPEAYSISFAVGYHMGSIFPAEQVKAIEGQSYE
jgi:hypothetical protein